MKRKIYNTLVIIFLTIHLQAQVNYSFSDPLQVVKQHNLITNVTKLNNFYKDLKRSNNQVVSIIHIGDSHLQADWLTGKARIDLQKIFGNAGRGTIFPYRVAKTNGPDDYTDKSIYEWNKRRAVKYENNLPIGLAGVTIQSTEPNYFQIDLKQNSSLDYSFNEVTIFTNTNQAPDLRLIQVKNMEDIDGQDCSPSKNNGICNFKFNQSANSFKLGTYMKEGEATNLQIFGALLKNGQNGILYNMIGVNGAKFKDFNLSEYFQYQLAHINPSLIIISLGTNEAQNASLTQEEFTKDIDKMIKELQQNNPHSSILITTPPDSYFNKVKPNPYLASLVGAINAYGIQNDIPIWDLYNIVGGEGSSTTLKTKKILSSDGVHFTKSGYEYQAQLLVDALMTGYNNYLKTNQ